MPMTFARHHTIDPQAPGFFHRISRCVRRAFLCGEGIYTVRSYEHRKAWGEERLLALAECFAVGLYRHEQSRARGASYGSAGSAGLFR
jgi:hypothetical protein